MTRRADSEGLLSTLPAVPAGGPEWLAGLRRDAAERLREGGLPGKKHEKWRFTSVREVVDTAFAPARPDDVQAALRWANERLGDDGSARVVLVDGRPVLEGIELPAGVRVSSLAAALKDAPHELEPVLGKLAPPEHFAGLNAALFDDGLVVTIAEGAIVERPIAIVHVASPNAAPAAAYPRVAVIAGEGSQAVLIETYLAQPSEARHLTNTVTEIALRANARLDHARVVHGADHALHLAYLAVEQGRDSFYGSRVVTLGGALSRLDVDLYLRGEGAEAELDGVYHADRREHVDHHLRVEHVAGHCSSRVRYRGLLDGAGHAVFDAIGVVRPGAAGTSAHQENRNLLLSDEATIDTKPHLEIETDEVQASHGTTVGAVDDAQLFYLRARGIPEAEARDVLTFAFVRELLERIPHPPLVRTLAREVLARLPSGERIQELSE